jgi:hypothetical protein
MNEGIFLAIQSVFAERKELRTVLHMASGHVSIFSWDGKLNGWGA